MNRHAARGRLRRRTGIRQRGAGTVRCVQSEGLKAILKAFPVGKLERAMGIEPTSWPGFLATIKGIAEARPFCLGHRHKLFA